MGALPGSSPLGRKNFPSANSGIVLRTGRRLADTSCMNNALLQNVLDLIRFHPYLTGLVGFVGALSFGLMKLATILPH